LRFKVRVRVRVKEGVRAFGGWIKLANAYLHYVKKPLNFMHTDI
jgi:hypothetical protein